MLFTRGYGIEKVLLICCICILMSSLKATKPADISEEQLQRITDAIVTRLKVHYICYLFIQVCLILICIILLFTFKLLIHTLGPIGGKNEIERSYYIDAVLRDIVKSCGKDVQIYQQYNIVGSRVDFVIKHVNTMIYITEAKITDIEQGICQNFIQLHSACKVNYISYYYANTNF